MQYQIILSLMWFEIPEAKLDASIRLKSVINLFDIVVKKKLNKCSLIIFFFGQRGGVIILLIQQYDYYIHSPCLP